MTYPPSNPDSAQPYYGPPPHGPAGPDWSGGGYPPASGQPTEPPHSPKKSRVGLILGITIPVGVVAALAITAAFVLPEHFKQQRIAEAVATFDNEHSAWESAFDHEMLAQITEAFDEIPLLAAANGERTTAPSHEGYTPLSQQCAQLDVLTPLPDGLDNGTIPQRPDVEGAQGDAAYDDAVSRFDQNNERYRASADLLDALDEELAVLVELCGFVAAFSDIWDLALEFEEEYAEHAEGMAYGDSFEIVVDGDIWLVTCELRSGCWDQETPASRESYASSIENYYVAYDRAVADLVSDWCPLEEWEELCQETIEAVTHRADLEQALADAVRLDPVDEMREHGHNTHTYNQLSEELSQLFEAESNSNEPHLFELAAERFLTGQDRILEARDGVLTP